MNTINTYFIQAELSLAAYGTFTVGAIPLTKLTGNDVGMSATQAAAFATAFTVVDQYTDPASGFSATVFERGGQRYLAIRGTQPSDVLDLIADADLALSGAAAKQTVALYNYIQRLDGVKGQSVAQLEWNGQDYTLNPAGAVGLLDTPLSGSLEITGHSLGGHLAMAFGRLFPQATSQIYTLNAPGFIDAAADSFFARIDAALGRSSSTFADAKTVNLYGSGLSIIAGYANDHGTPQEIFLESNAHSIVDITDSLAVYNLLVTLDPTLNTDPNGIGKITDILKASSNIAANTLESVVADLGKLFLVNGAAGFTANEFDSSTNGRDLLYTALNDIEAALPTSGGLSLAAVDAASILVNAQATTPDAIAYRYALVNGNPFAVLGADYSPHNPSGALDLYVPATGAGNLTGQYLKDRSGYLIAKLYDNSSDGTINTLKDVRYRDLETNTTLSPINTEQRRVTFGGAANEGFSGAAGNDGLWNNAANDARYEVSERRAA